MKTLYNNFHIIKKCASADLEVQPMSAIALRWSVKVITDMSLKGQLISHRVADLDPPLLTLPYSYNEDCMKILYNNFHIVKKYV